MGSKDQAIRAELDKQVNAFRQIVTLRAHIQTLERQLFDLKARALQNIQRERDKDVVPTVQEDLVQINKITDTTDLLILAKKKFTEFDVNKSGYLDDEELLVIADWVWSVFALDGMDIKRVDALIAKRDLLEKFDANDDGVLDFDEFAEWLLATITRLKKEKGEASQQLGKDMDIAKKQFKEAQKHKRSRSDQRANPLPKHHQRNVSHGNKSPHTLLELAEKQQLNKSDPQRPGERSPKRFKSHREAALHAKEPWRCLLTRTSSDARELKYKGPARNRIQLFLRLDVQNKNSLGESEIRDILVRCGVKQSNMRHVMSEFVKKFNGANNVIKMENFVDFLPCDANEKHIYVMVQSILGEIRDTYE